MGVAAFRHTVFPQRGRTSLSAVNLSLPTHRTAGFPTPGVTREEGFVRWLFEQAGLESSDYKAETLHRRVPACLRALRAGSISDARAMVLRSPANLRTALSAVLIGVTGFFRDASVFDHLSRCILPELTACGTGARIWSVGCSDGQELYSIAMLLAEANLLCRCTFLGTDCRADAIAAAGKAIYTSDALRSLPEGMRKNIACQRAITGVCKIICATAVQWRSANALALREPGLWDLIVCRNMVIYMTADAASRLWQSLADSLRPGGILMLGKAERTLGVAGLTQIAPCFYRRQLS